MLHHYTSLTCILVISYQLGLQYSCNRKPGPPQLASQAVGKANQLLWKVARSEETVGGAKRIISVANCHPNNSMHMREWVGTRPSHAGCHVFWPGSLFPQSFPIYGSIMRLLSGKRRHTIPIQRKALIIKWLCFMHCVLFLYHWVTATTMYCAIMSLHRHQPPVIHSTN